MHLAHVSRARSNGMYTPVMYIHIYSSLSVAPVAHSEEFLSRNPMVPGSVSVWTLGLSLCFSDETSNRGTVYRCFTPSTLKNQAPSLIPHPSSRDIVGHMGLWAYSYLFLPIQSTTTMKTDVFVFVRKENVSSVSGNWYHVTYCKLHSYFFEKVISFTNSVRTNGKNYLVWTSISVWWLYVMSACNRIWKVRDGWVWLWWKPIGNIPHWPVKGTAAHVPHEKRHHARNVLEFAYQVSNVCIHLGKLPNMILAESKIYIFPMTGICITGLNST